MSNTVAQAVARKDEAKPTVAKMIHDLQPELRRALPKHLDADRLARIALTVVRKDPKLARCDPYSFAGALLTCAELGLEPGVGGEAYLVPYGKECQLIVGYQGFAKLFWQHPLAKHLDAQAVHANDDFEYEYGLNPFLRHKPARGNRGEVTDYYAVAGLSTGGTAFVVLSPEEVKELRGGKVGPKGDIPDPQRWMERKTALRQLFKLLPKSPTLARALDSDEQVGSQLMTEHEPSKELEAGPPPNADEITGEIVDGKAEDYDPRDES